MKLKLNKFSYTAIVVLFGITLFASCSSYSVPFVKINVHVTNYDKEPLANASVRGIFYKDKEKFNRKRKSHAGETNVNGLVTIKGRENIYVDIFVERNGYYAASKRFVVRGDTEFETTIILREIKNPMPTLAKHVLMEPPVEHDPSVPYEKVTKSSQYDFLLGDYLPPYGVGKTGDVILTKTMTYEDTFIYEWELTVEFSNNLDGMTAYYANNGTYEYPFEYKAPSEGYEAKWVWHERRAGVWSPPEGNLNRLNNYYFRIRTETDEQGTVVGGHYGKIKGEFPHILYFLNPTQNDPNVEHDVTRYLFNDLDLTERPPTSNRDVWGR